MTRRLQVLAKTWVLTLVFFGAGCSESTTELQSCDSDLPGPSLSGDKLDLLPAEPTGFLTGDDKQAQIAREVPGGWGGMFFAEGRPTIYLVNPDARDAAVAVLQEKIPSFSFATADIWQARWDFAQLYDWYRYIGATIGRPDGVLTSDIDEKQNRLVYGIRADALDSVRVLFELADLPCELVVFEEATPIIFNNVQDIAFTGKEKI